ncbi:hypothetical protein VPH35_024581 [Triticum aestivum]
MAPSPPTAPKTIADFFVRPAKRLRSSAAKPSVVAPAASLSPSSPSSPSDPTALSPEQRRRADTNLALARARRNLRLAESKAGGGAKLEELLVEETWLEALSGELRKPYALDLCRFVAHERLNAKDPYHGPGQAMGLSFSVPEGIKIPSSLQNIFKELHKDLGCTIPSHGNLERWAVQGILMLNTVLTVREHQANSHAKKGWEQFTDAVIKTVSQKKSGLVFILWGNSAQAKIRLIDETKHHILKSAHPSGLSANRGFFGCRHFSQTNQILERLGLSTIDWQL